MADPLAVYRDGKARNLPPAFWHSPEYVLYLDFVGRYNDCVNHQLDKMKVHLGNRTVPAFYVRECLRNWRDKAVDKAFGEVADAYERRTRGGQ